MSINRKSGCFIIYKIGNKVNHMLYIGVTTYRLNDRLTTHLARIKDDTATSKLYDAIRSLGKDKFYIIELYRANTAEEAKIKEVEFISAMDSVNNGYNSLIGGGGNLFSEIEKEPKKKKKTSDWMKGNKYPSKLFNRHIQYILNYAPKKTYAEWANIFNVHATTISKAITLYKKRQNLKA